MSDGSSFLEKLGMPRYPSSLNDDEWEILRKLIPKSPLSLRGRPVSYSKRSIIDGILHIIRSGAGWRLMPNDLPHWKTCYHYLRIWAKQDVWLRIHDASHDKARVALGKKSPDRCDPRQPECSDS